MSSPHIHVTISSSDIHMTMSSPNSRDNVISYCWCNSVIKWHSCDSVISWCWCDCHHRTIMCDHLMLMWECHLMFLNHFVICRSLLSSWCQPTSWCVCHSRSNNSDSDHNTRCHPGQSDGVADSSLTSWGILCFRSSRVAVVTTKQQQQLLVRSHLQLFHQHINCLLIFRSSHFRCL